MVSPTPTPTPIPPPPPPPPMFPKTDRPCIIFPPLLFPALSAVEEEDDDQSPSLVGTALGELFLGVFLPPPPPPPPKNNLGGEAFRLSLTVRRIFSGDIFVAAIVVADAWPGGDSFPPPLPPPCLCCRCLGLPLLLMLLPGEVPTPPPPPPLGAGGGVDDFLPGAGLPSIGGVPTPSLACCGPVTGDEPGTTSLPSPNGTAALESLSDRPLAATGDFDIAACSLLLPPLPLLDMFRPPLAAAAALSFLRSRSSRSSFFSCIRSNIGFSLTLCQRLLAPGDVDGWGTFAFVSCWCSLPPHAISSPTNMAAGEDRPGLDDAAACPDANADVDPDDPTKTTLSLAKPLLLPLMLWFRERVPRSAASTL